MTGYVACGLSKSNEFKDIPSTWLRPGEPAAKSFEGAMFWKGIQNNFVEGKRCATHLSDDLRAKVRALPWAGAAIRELLEKRAKAVS